MSINHPAEGEERKHLAETLEVVNAERAVAEREKANAEGELAFARMYDQDALPIRELLYSRALTTLRNMDLAAKKPYFTRIDFTETSGEEHVYYIGKYGITRTDSQEVQVVDWRAPVANLYYSGQVGPMHYVSPDGEVTGNLTLKRQIGIEDGELVTIFDTDVVSRDAYLQSVLGCMTGDRLREIVTTIQAEQNFVIRYPLDKTLVVQGVAGSGKTTIALHRIAYLLYAFRDTLRPEQMLILAPNPLFLNFISGVLPDLGVDQVRQSTFPIWMAEFLEGYLPAVDRNDRTEQILSMSPDALDRITRIAQTKGSLRMAQIVEDWLDAFEKRFSPKEGLRFGPVVLFTHAQLDQFLLVDEKPFPMQRRMKEFEKQLRAAVKSAAKKINDYLQRECDRRAETLRATVQDATVLQKKLNALYASRDERMKQTLDQVRPYMKTAMAAFPDCTPMRLYRLFWQEQRTSADADIALAAAHTCERFAENLPLENEDVALFALMAMRLVERKRPNIRHIVVDEAQDFSPIEFAVLRKIAPSATMTIVGDMMQGVQAWRGLADWRILTDGVFAGKATMHHLITSYRSTIEIMSFASRVVRNRPVPDQQMAKPVLRHGDLPDTIRMDSLAQEAESIAETIEQWRKDGCSTIAIIARSGATLKELHQLLPERIHANILDVNAEIYTGGVLLAHAGAVKGLEFDGVILADASAACFPNRDLDARLLYVCCTRALHKLRVYYAGEISPLLKA